MGAGGAGSVGWGVGGGRWMSSVRREMRAAGGGEDMRGGVWDVVWVSPDVGVGEVGGGAREVASVEVDETSVCRGLGQLIALEVRGAVGV